MELASMKPPATVSSLNYLATPGAIYQSAFTALLLTLALGCHQPPDVSHLRSPTATNGDPHAKPIAETNYTSARILNITNSTMSGANARTPLMSIWHSPDATAEDRATAITKWLPQDTSIASAQALLGKHGALSHHFGPSFGFAEDTNTGFTSQTGGVDVWLLEYDTPRGRVALRFSRGFQSTNALRFDGAYTDKQSLVPPIK